MYIDVNNLRKSLNDFGYVSNRLFVKVTPKNGNEYLLTQVCHREISDLVLVPNAFICKEETGEIISAPVTYEMLEKYNIEENVFIDLALLNSECIFPAVIENIDVLLKNIMGVPASETDASTSIVVTNEDNAFGASALFYPGMMEELARRHKGNYFILPSSIHEMITVSDDGEITYEELREMVTDINHTQVAPKERLTDEVYYYDDAKREFRKGNAK